MYSPAKIYYLGIKSYGEQGDEGNNETLRQFLYLSQGSLRKSNEAYHHKIHSDLRIDLSVTESKVPQLFFLTLGLLAVHQNQQAKSKILNPSRRDVDHLLCSKKMEICLQNHSNSSWIWTLSTSATQNKHISFLLFLIFPKVLCRR